MPDSPAVKSARGHLDTYEEFAGRERERLARGGPFPVSEEHSRRMLAHYEEKLTEWRRVLEAALRADATVTPLA